MQWYEERILKQASKIEELEEQLSRSITWSIEDIQGRAKQVYDKDITDQDAQEILERIIHFHDANIGVNWENIDYHTQMFVLDNGNKL